MFLILLNFGWMVELAMSIFEFLIKFTVFWHPWHPWVCIRSVCWNKIWNRLKQFLPVCKIPTRKVEKCQNDTISVLRYLIGWNFEDESIILKQFFWGNLYLEKVQIRTQVRMKPDIFHRFSLPEHFSSIKPESILLTQQDLQVITCVIS